jgi:hypothetical protein
MGFGFAGGDADGGGHMLMGLTVEIVAPYYGQPEPVEVSLWGEVLFAPSDHGSRKLKLNWW